jgi:hypothetical protein
VKNTKAFVKLRRKKFYYIGGRANVINAFTGVINATAFEVTVSTLSTRACSATPLKVTQLISLQSQVTTVNCLRLSIDVL